MLFQLVVLFFAGEKVITRRVFFKTSNEYYCNTDYPGVNDSQFEENLCQLIIKKIPDIAKAVDEKAEAATRVESYILDQPECFNRVLGEVYRFIKAEKITHYISTIVLGATSYSVSITSKCCHTNNLKSEAGVDFLAGIGGGVMAICEKKHKKSRDCRIGDIDIISRGKGEAVIGYQLQPLFTLVSDEHKQIKRVLQTAIQFYIERSSKLMWYP